MSESAKIKIDKFAGAGESGLFYNEGFSPSTENGKSILNESFASYERMNNITVGFSDISNIKAVAFLNTLSGNEAYRLLLDDYSHLYAFSDAQSLVKNGKVGGVSSTGNYLYCQNPDILELPSGNLIYTSAYHLSFIIRGTCGTGSNATTIIDKAGRNLTTLGVLSSDANKNKVVNLRTGVTFTINAVTKTTNDNDTLTFSSIGSNVNSANDEFLIFIYDKWDLKTGLTLPSFKSQPDGMHWARQVKAFDGNYFILNGNYLAKLDVAESTLTIDFKRFPIGHQSISFDANADKILFSTYSASGAYLCLWDGFNEKFNNIIRIDSPAFEVKAYSSGWIFMINGVIYYTNGYAIQTLNSYLDAGELSNISIDVDSFNQIVALNDTVYIASSWTSGNKSLCGIYAYSAKHGWSFIPAKYKARNYANPTSIFINNGYDSIYGTFNQTLEIGGAKFYNSVYAYNAESSPNFRSFIYFIDLPSKTQINKVELTLARSFKKLLTSYNIANNSKISVSIGDGSNGIISKARYSTIPSKTTITIDGRYQSVQVGDELIFLDGECRGERSVIQAISNQGTASEWWTLSQELSGTDLNAGYVRIIRVKHCETKIVDLLTAIKEPISFKVDGSFYKQVYLEVVIYGTDTSYPVSILDINIF